MFQRRSAMKNTIDYTLKEIANEIGYDEKVIKEAVRSLEEKYFKNFHIFRNTGEKSNIIFRYEIKELLVLLVKLEIDSPFTTIRKKKDGVTINNSKKLYTEYINGIDDNKYYKNTLKSIESVSRFNESVHIITQFSESLSNLMITIARHYYKLEKDFFVKMIEQFDQWSKDIIYCSQFLNFDEEKYVYSRLLSEKGYCFDFQDDIVTVIDKISVKIYGADSNGILYRIPLNSIVEEFYSGDDKKSLISDSEKCFNLYSKVQRKKIINNCIYQKLPKKYVDLILDDVAEEYRNIGSGHEMRTLFGKPREELFKTLCIISEFNATKILSADEMCAEKEIVRKQLDVVLDKIFNDKITSSNISIISHNNSEPLRPRFNDYTGLDCGVSDYLYSYYELLKFSSEMNEEDKKTFNLSLENLISSITPFEKYKILNFPLFISIMHDFDREIDLDNMDDDTAYDVIKSILHSVNTCYSFERQVENDVFKKEFIENIDNNLESTDLSNISKNAIEIKKSCDNIITNIIDIITKLNG